ncbi:MAG: AbrB/MazE/SpoVT family DNA-binding domain-containing protein [Betaproteobacteria bacterium]|nr:AbrB/MazE/SpoVT family DNA-binding domain-containing protein [Betaproteobacteria bacterium]
MTTATMTSKGQLTIPKAVRDALGLATGDRVQFIEQDGGFRIVAATRDALELKGMFAGRRRKTATLEEIKSSAARGATRRFLGTGK